MKFWSTAVLASLLLFASIGACATTPPRPVATGGGYVASGTIDFPPGGDQGAVIALDVPANRDQAVSLALMQVSGPANVIMPQTVLLPATAEYIFANGFE